MIHVLALNFGALALAFGALANYFIKFMTASEETHFKCVSALAATALFAAFAKIKICKQKSANQVRKRSAETLRMRPKIPNTQDDWTALNFARVEGHADIVALLTAT